MIGPFALNTVHCGDALELLRQLPDESVQCCVSSPPYWGLRDYGTGRWEGGNPECKHTKTTSDKLGPDSPFARATNANHALEGWKGGICGKCGARKIDTQAGLEPTPEIYVAKMVNIFSEVKRALKSDGTIWINLGDSYAGSGKGIDSDHGKSIFSDDDIQKTDWNTMGIPAKNLIGIPWRVAFALQAAGWYLRADIIWSKPNPMPESVTDRPTKSHEYLFLLAKSQRYYYDAEAIKEKCVYDLDGKETQARKNRAHEGDKGFPTKEKNGIRPRKLTNPAGWASGKDHSAVGWAQEQAQGRKKDKQRGHERRHDGFNDRWDQMSNAEQQSNGRNKRSVWEIATMPYSGAHFATYPKALVEPCILAGSRPGDIILDPFTGSGTTGVVALQHGRKFIGFDLNPKYCTELAAPRLAAAERGQTVEQYQAGQTTIFDLMGKLG
jgi:DNA modification methylase